MSKPTMPKSEYRSSDPLARRPEGSSLPACLEAVRRTDAALAAVVEDLDAGRLSAQEAIGRAGTLPIYRQGQWARWVRFAIRREGRGFGFAVPAWPAVVLLAGIELIAYPVAYAALRLLTAGRRAQDLRKFASLVPPFALTRTLLTLATSGAPLCLSATDGGDGFHFSIE